VERDGRVKVGFYEIGISGAKWANSILKDYIKKSML